MKKKIIEKLRNPYARGNEGFAVSMIDLLEKINEIIDVVNEEPELGESEDERIRKWLLEAIENMEPKMFIEVKKVDVLAWLANQKEQKPNIEICPHSIKSKSYSMHPIMTSEMFQGKLEQKDCSGCSKHLEGYISGRGDAENKLLADYGILIMPDGELRMKPKWKPSDEMMEALDYAITGHFDMIPPTSYLSRRLEDLYERLKSQQK